jgi:hypothetical protein
MAAGPLGRAALCDRGAPCVALVLDATGCALGWAEWLNVMRDCGVDLARLALAPCDTADEFR